MSPLNASLIGWILPGAGHWVLGQRGKAVMFAAIIFATFFIGVALAGGHAVSFEREQIYFWGEFGAVAPTLVGLGIDRLVAIDEIPSTYHLGLLYATVAGLLNLVVAVDAFGVALARDRGEGGSVMTPLDLVFYAPLCLAITFVWAGTREDSREKIIRHGVALFVRATVGLLVFCLGLQLLIAVVAGA